jgi:very-short-patch-repair endonuclease
MKTEDYTLQYILNGVKPTCACGCGKFVSYVPEVPLTYRTYYSGHYALHHPEIWGDKSDPERLKKSAQTYKDRYAKGEIKNPWKGKTKHEVPHIMKFSLYSTKAINPDKAKETSEKLKGRKFTEEHKKNLSKAVREYSQKPEYREECRQRKMNFLINNHKQYTSKLEDYFIENYLTPNNILFKRNFYAKGIKSFYDFYLPEFNVIIEVDGDYWHCNPKIFPEAKYASQKRNIIKDVIKNEWAIENGYTIVRFWEKDIKEEPGTVLNKLVEIGVILDKNPK